MQEDYLVDLENSRIALVDVSEKALEECKKIFPEYSTNFFLENIDCGLHFENEKFDFF